MVFFMKVVIAYHLFIVSPDCCVRHQPSGKYNIIKRSPGKTVPRLVAREASLPQESMLVFLSYSHCSWNVSFKIKRLLDSSDL